ncbi:acyl-CoA thioester hydrolase [Enterococcus xinjiangensis]|nr:acyl-CoA thioester hydrolase [Enterococcus lactis]MBL4998898.1 acyl-CoA thioester hydrolase [Enterococcus lactis]MBL5000522.1 acyl-CoA thioester hydrolase [Enterococcus lactis]
MILCGTKDYANKPGAKRLYKVPANSRLLFIENGKQELNREKPEIMAQAMRSFIKNS